ncbi:DUF4064 domain-containing protein [Virgibacillus xinjiangensis]|uniref:DUF4064 domain-containing protein n=1 Tax=Virgibacillus xinjiangensis TaxID=393090 RepID=A0ABV7CSB1_9BACI
MKRTGEVILGIIGMLVYTFFAIVGGFMVWMGNNRSLFQQLPEELSQQGVEISEAELNSIVETMGNSGTLFLITSLAAIILGIVSLVLLRGNKKPKASGIILIVTAVISSIIMTIVGFAGGLFYLIAGIMALVRKPKPAIQDGV